MPSAPPLSAPAIQMANITKTFPGVTANDDISLAVWPSTIHAVIGENGAGKSTLMSILYGRYQPDRGRIRIQEADVRIGSPAQAIKLGIGMVTQHTTIIPALTVLENILLGAEISTLGFLNTGLAADKVDSIAKRLGIQLELRRAAESLSVAALQKAEIVKALFRGVNTLILDEPTATLGVSEAESLFALLHRLRESGATILLVTHKLREVMEHASRVSVLRGGRLVGERNVADTIPDELLGLMIGQRSSAAALTGEPSEARIFSLRSDEPLAGALPAYLAGNEPLNPAARLPTLEARNLAIQGRRGALAIRDLSLDVLPGEILGVAGVDGSGQRELAEAIVGLRPPRAGVITLDGKDISRESVGRRLRLGVTYVPEDQHREGLILDFTLAENYLLGRERDRGVGGGPTLDLVQIERDGEAMVVASRVRPTMAAAHARNLSGGNQQKVVIARALRGEPRLIVAMQPTRGLDVEATRFVYEQLASATRAGAAILLFSLDLDEILAVSDRVAVMFNGELMGILNRVDATPDRIGQMMVGARQ